EHGISGRMNFALTTRGTLDHPTTTGTWWLNNFSWGSPATENLEGNFEWTPQNFQIEAASEDNAVRLDAEGIRREHQLSLENAEIHLRSGAILTAEGRWLE